MRRSRSEYELVRETLDADWKTAFTPLGVVAAKILEDFYDLDPDAGSCPTETLIKRGQAKFAGSKHSETFADFVEGFDVGGDSVPNLLFDLRQSRRNRIGDELAGLFANRGSDTEIVPLLEKYRSLGEEDAESKDSSDIYHNTGVSDLLGARYSGGEGLSLGLRALDKACDGGAAPGHHILVFARPEVGKTLFTLDMVTSFIQQGARVLYVGNEDPLSDITLRVIQRLTRRSRDEVRADPEGTELLLQQRGYDRFIGASQSPGTFRSIEALVDEYEPQVLVLDQLRNLDVGDDNRVTALEKAAIGARNLGKSHGLVVVSITQAGDSAEGKSELGLSDIDFSKTGIPGAVDLAIGIGATEEDKRFGNRVVSLPKNKLGGNHISFPVRFDTRTGVVEEFD